MTVRTLARLVVLTDRRASELAGRSLSETVRLTVDAGARAVLLREKDLEPDERRRLAEALAAVTAPAGASLGIASDLGLARRLGLAWVHLAGRDALPAPAQRPALLGRSCHDTHELERAADDGVDYASLSPVLLTTSKPGYGPALGVDGFSRLAAAARVPVAALGGVGAAPGTAAAAWRGGACSVWVMGAVMGSADPAGVVRRLLGELSSVVGA